MIPIGIVLILGGYSIGSWGYCLVKGYNITLRQWFSPLNPYQWPPGNKPVPTVPKGSVFPTSKAPK